MSNINGHGYYHNLPFTTKWSPSSLCFHRSHINGEDLSSCVFDRWRNVSRVLSSVLEVKGWHFYLLKLCCFPTLGIFLLGTLRASRLFKASVNFNLIEIKNEEYKIERKKHKTLAWTALDSWLLGFLSSTSHKKISSVEEIWHLSGKVDSEECTHRLQQLQIKWNRAGRSLTARSEQLSKPYARKGL